MATSPLTMIRGVFTTWQRLAIVLATDGGANDGKAVELTGTSGGAVNVNVTGSSGSTTVTNDGTFAKETGGNLATIAGTVVASSTQGSFANPATEVELRPGGAMSALDTVSALTAKFQALVGILGNAIYHTTPTTRTNGQVGPLEADVNGNLNSNLGTLIAGEDITNNVLRIEARGTYGRITTQTTTVVKSGSGELYGIVLETPVASAVVTVYDNTAGSGTVIFACTLPAALLNDGPISIQRWASFGTGLTIVTSGATMNVGYDYR